MLDKIHVHVFLVLLTTAVMITSGCLGSTMTQPVDSDGDPLTISY